MNFNHKYFRVNNSKKLLHKVKGHWTTITLSLLMMLGSVGIADISARADDYTDNSNQLNQIDDQSERLISQLVSNLANQPDATQNGSDQDVVPPSLPGTSDDNDANIPSYYGSSDGPDLVNSDDSFNNSDVSDANSGNSNLLGSSDSFEPSDAFGSDDSNAIPSDDSNGWLGNSGPSSGSDVAPTAPNFSGESDNVPNSDLVSDTSDSIPNYSDSAVPSDDGNVSDNAQQNVSEMKQETLADINNERQQNGLSPLVETSDLDELAGVRAQQIASNFSHYDSDGNTYYRTDADQLGVDLDDYQSSGENIAGASLGDTGMDDDPKPYDNNNGYDMADMDNDAMMNYDSDQNNGHRNNILSHDYQQVGIGAYSVPGTDNYYLAEDFRG